MGARSAASRVSARSATAFSFRQVDHLRLGPQLLLEPEGPGAPGQPEDLAAGVGEVPEDDGARRAGLGARWDILSRGQLAPLSQGPLPGLLEAVMAEGALFHDALGAHRNVGILPGGFLLVA